MYILRVFLAEHLGLYFRSWSQFCCNEPRIERQKTGGAAHPPRTPQCGSDPGGHQQSSSKWPSLQHLGENWRRRVFVLQNKVDHFILPANDGTLILMFEWMFVVCFSASRSDPACRQRGGVQVPAVPAVSEAQWEPETCSGSAPDAEGGAAGGRGAAGQQGGWGQRPSSIIPNWILNCYCGANKLKMSGLEWESHYQFKKWINLEE